MFLLHLLLAASAATVLPSAALAKECDNYTGRDRVITDALEPLDRFTNALIDEALNKANDTKRGCEPRRLYAALDDKLGATPIGVIETWAQHTRELDHLQDDQDGPGSIYNGFSGLHYPLLAATGVAHSIRVAGHVIGTDKLGHFMAEGFHTYRIFSGKDGSMEKAMAWGHGTEEGIFGLTVSGVKSFGDLSANYSGARFWFSVLYGRDPYFTCRDDKYAKIRRFTWKDYVNDSWDEAINCSQFGRSMGATVLGNLARRNQTCPVAGTAELCRDLVLLPDAQLYVSPVCKLISQKPGVTVEETTALLLFRKNRDGRRGD